MSEWISVDEKLPKYDVPVLVVPKGHPNEISTAIRRWYYDDWMWEEFTGFGYLTDESNYELDDEYEYTHWMPLPEPPEKK